MLDSSEWTRLENSFTAWGREQTALRAAVAVGSRVRIDPPGDEWSDLDLMLFFAGREDFIRTSEWINAIGEVWAALPSHVAGGEPEWLVTFAGGYNVDFVLLDYSALMGLIQANPLPEPFIRGYRILIDKDDLAAQIPPAPGKTITSLPSPEDFTRVVTAFWYTAYYIAKQIRRGELYLAKVRDGNLKEQLMTMLQWHALAVQGPEADIWHLGRFMERWVDPKTLAELPATFGTYDSDGSWRALHASTELFRRLTRETSARLGFPYPSQIGERMSMLIDSLAK